MTVSDMDWAAAMDSEVFRTYAAAQLKQAQSQPASDEIDNLEVLEGFEKFEAEVRASPAKLKAFRLLQEKFANDPEYTDKVKKSFVDAVMLLNLDSETL